MAIKELKKFTAEELAKYDGREGRPAYFAYKGKVYDTSESALWEDGVHFEHEAGKELTAAMEDAPHGEDSIRDMPVVGEYEE